MCWCWQEAFRASMPDDIYRNILKRLDGKGILIAVDATGNLLVNVLEYHPFLVKPNNHELGEIFGVELKDRESVIPYAKKMQEMGATNVLVSMAGEGAVLAQLTERSTWHRHRKENWSMVWEPEILWWPDS